MGTFALKLCVFCEIHLHWQIAPESCTGIARTLCLFAGYTLSSPPKLHAFLA